MRMILVHGISQEGKSEDKILEEWMEALRPQFDNATPNPLERLTRIQAAFYGDTLHELSQGRVKDEYVTMGTEETDPEFEQSMVKALKALARRAKVTDQQIDDEVDAIAVAQAAGPHKEWLKTLARAIERFSPLKGTLALRVLGQAHAYIRNQNVHDEINEKVRPLFEADESAIVISHSLGTVVTYKLLREFAAAHRPRKVPLFLTLGSPLGIDTVRRSFTLPRTRPANVARWVNCADPEDFVALHSELTEETFAAGIENLPDFENGDENAHGIRGYLSDPRVAELVTQAIG